MTTWSSFPPGVSAITFCVRPAREVASTLTDARLPSPSPASARVDTTTTGIRIPVAASVPLGTPRLLLTSSSMTSAVAPARSAFCALTREKQSPRSTSGIWPRSSPSKSEASQPRPDSRSVPVARPEPE